ncbi:hypothetical protein BJ912DRAFT_980840 [Pholiota molesta]|nr:hypothetical protein BJ912DRAFT_980840 [Pholiota molesta]
MLLCRICSCWRTVALGTPSLWLHLAHLMRSYGVERQPRSWKVRQKDLDFMIWWKRNQGAMAPFLLLYTILSGPNPSRDPPLAEGGMDFVLQYMRSAQFLRVTPFFWEKFHDKCAGGDHIVFPHLHTIVADKSNDIQFYRAQVLIGRVSTPTSSSSALRRLYMNGYHFKLPVDAVAPSHWSKLTHLSMHDITISVPSWFSFIRAFPDLQWASISLGFNDEYAIKDYKEPPSEFTLPRLSTFLLTCCKHCSDYVALPFALLFTGLSLPALQTLSLTSLVGSWEDHHTMAELYTVLRSTPAVTTLALRGCDHGFLSLHKPNYPTILSAIGDVEPIWRYAPHLTHLLLTLPYVDNQTLDTFVRNFFWPDCGWLALDNCAHPIRRVTFISGNRWNHRFDNIKEWMMASILSHTGEASDITFEIVTQTAVYDIGSEGWRTWDL